MSESPTKAPEPGKKKAKGRGRPTKRREGRSRGDGLRICLGCNRAYAPASMLKVIAGPDGLAHVDVSGKLPGRGAYVYSDGPCVAEAVRRKRFGRALRSEGIEVNADLLVEEALRGAQLRIQRLLAVAQKAGRVVSGGETVQRTLKQGKLAFILLAADASEVTARKVEGWGRGAEIPVYRVKFSVEEFGHLLGKRPRAVAGLRRGELARTIELELAKAERLAKPVAPKGRCLLT